MRSSLLRPALAIGAALLTAGAIGFIALRPGAERAADPMELAELTASSIRRAHAEGAERHAPVNLATAEEFYAEALLERRRQQLRVRWVRDFRSARATFEASMHRAEEAVGLAQRAIRRDRTQANRALAAAEGTLEVLAGIEDRVWMPDSTRQRLQRARALTSEARSLLAAAAFTEAAARAREARREAEGVSAAVQASTERFTDRDRLSAWRRWAAETVAWSRSTGKTAVVVDKDAHRLMVYQAGKLVREYDAELGWQNIGDKRIQGDGATPEGRYKITELKGRGRSRYHKALLLDYPNREDMANLAALKASGAVPAGTRAGSLIEIHGEGGRGRDWTDGCVAITNAQMDWLFTRVGVGTPVTIVGSLTGEGHFADVARRLTR